MLTTLTPAYSEAFAAECIARGLNVKQAGVLLWRQRMDEAMERPAFRDAYISELQKLATAKPGIFSQMDAALADKGSMGANVGHYSGRGATVGGTAGLLSALPLLLGKNKLKGVGRLLPSLKRVALGAGVGGVAGGGYGAHKAVANDFKIDPRALNLNPLPAPQGATQSQPGGPVDIYSRDGLRFGPPPSTSSDGDIGKAPGAVSDSVRLQQPAIDASDRRIQELENQRKTFRRTGNPAADYAQERTISESIAAEQKARDQRQKDMNQSLVSLKTEQGQMNQAIDREMPNVREREQYFAGRGDAAESARHQNWLARKFMNWVGGTPEEYDPVWKYKVDQSRAQAARQNMEQSLANPPLYR